MWLWCLKLFGRPANLLGHPASTVEFSIEPSWMREFQRSYHLVYKPFRHDFFKGLTWGSFSCYVYGMLAPLHTGGGPSNVCKDSYYQLESK